jgi:hypothetical protein
MFIHVCDNIMLNSSRTKATLWYLSNMHRKNEMHESASRSFNVRLANFAHLNIKAYYGDKRFSSSSWILHVITSNFI